MTDQPSTTTRPKFRCIVSADLFRRAMACVSTEDRRYYLQGVHIEPHPEKGAVLVSTDGHRLICLHDPNAIIENDAIVRPNMQMTVNLKILSKPAAIKRECHGIANPNILLVVEGNRMALAIGTGGNGPHDVAFFDKLREPDMSVIAMQWHSALIDGAFPNWKKVVPKPETLKPDGPIGEFNPRYLLDLAEALSSEKGRGVRIVSAGGCEPHLIRASNPEIEGFGIIMPMRAGASQAYPKFVDALFPKPVEPPKSEAAKAGEKVAAMTAARAKTRKARTKVTAPAKKPAAKKAPAKKAARAS